MRCFWCIPIFHDMVCFPGKCTVPVFSRAKNWNLGGRIGNTFRAWKPAEHQDPGVCFSLLTVVILTRTGAMETMDDGIRFIWRIFKSFLVGFAMAAGVSLFILPSTCRGTIFTGIQDYISQAQAALEALVDFVHETPDEVLLATPALLEEPDLQTVQTVQTLRTAADTDGIQVARDRVAKAVNGLNALDAKIQANLGYAKIELAWGKLSAADLEKISELFRKLLLTLSGIAAFPTILDHFLETDTTLSGETVRESMESVAQTSTAERKTAHIVHGLRASLDELSLLVRVGLGYFLSTLEVVQTPWFPPYHSQDQPSERQSVELVDLDEAPISLDPNSPTFIEDFTRSLKDLSRRKQAIKELIEHSEQVDVPVEESLGIQHEYCLALYIFYMEDLVADAVSSIVAFAESKVDDGTMSRSRLIYPTFWEWYNHDSETPEEPSVYSDFSQPRDFEEGAKVADSSHLVPVNTWERWGGGLSKITRFLGSDLSMFGLRVAAASLCIGIVAFLQDTQEFFIRQRGVWAMVVVVIGMSPTSGQTLFGFFSRILATLAAIALSFASWYIVVGHTAGVLVFLYLSNVILVSLPVPPNRQISNSVSSFTFMSRCPNTLALR